MKIESTEEQKAYLRENSVEFEDALEKNDLEALLEAIDDAIVENIVTHNDEPDEKIGRASCRERV